MPNVLIEENSLVAIGDALRRKLGETKPGDGCTTVFRTSDNLDDFEKSSWGGSGTQYANRVYIEFPDNATKVKVVVDENSTINYLSYYHNGGSQYAVSKWGSFEKEFDKPNAMMGKDRLEFNFNTGSWKGETVSYTAHLYFYDAEGNLITEELPNTWLVSEMAGAIDDINPYIEPIIEALNITENGTYEVSDGVDGYNPITVEINPTLITLETSDNGTYIAADKGADGFDKVVINVPTSGDQIPNGEEVEF